MTQLLLHLFAQVVETFEVFTGMRDPVLGLAPPLLVFGDPGSLLKIDAQVLGACLDNARDHALFDD